MYLDEEGKQKDRKFCCRKLSLVRCNFHAINNSIVRVSLGELHIHCIVINTTLSARQCSCVECMMFACVIV